MTSGTPMLSTGESRGGTDQVALRRSRVWLDYVVGGLPLISAWAALEEIARNPARDSTTKIGSFGMVTIEPKVGPNPPWPISAVQLSFMPMDPHRQSVPLDGAPFQYGREGSDQAIVSGQPELMSAGSDMFTPALALRASAVEVRAAPRRKCASACA